MDDKIALLEIKIKELEDELNKQNDYYTKLSNEREIVRNNINTVNGALQAYRVAIQLVREGADLPPSMPNVIENA